MGKKSKKRSRWFWALWLLVSVAAVSLFLMPLHRPTPKMNWRAPVHVAMPDMAKVKTEIENAMPEMPQLPMKDIEKFGEKLGGDLAHKVEESMPDLADLPYEAPLKPPVETVPAKPIPVPAPLPAEKGHNSKIALIIDDMGLVARLSERAVHLPASVTLAYLPYAPRLMQQAENAQAKGHDLMLHLPMEPVGNENPGPGALLSGQSEEEWRVRLDAALHSFDGYIGVNNHMGSKMTINDRAMTVVSEVLRERGLYFIDSRTNTKSVAEKIARESGLKVGARDIFLDDTQTPNAVRAELAHLEQVARRKGSAIAIGHPHAVTLDALEVWIPQAQSRGFEIVPVRELVK